jgi:hypothetical protein
VFLREKEIGTHTDIEMIVGGMERRKPSPTQGEKPQNETNLWTP